MKGTTDGSKGSVSPLGLTLVAGAIAILALEGFSFLVLALMPQILGWEVRRTGDILDEQRVRATAVLEEADSRTQLDSALGWIYRPGFSGPGEGVNLLGARGTREYTPQPSQGTLRIAAFGDSFMYGNEVAVEDAWSSQLERRHPHVEVLNFGVGGYGTDQAFLRYLQKRGEFDEDWVLIGFVAVNLRRSVNIYRRFISDQEWPLVKPRFVEDPPGSLRLLPNPLPTPAHYRRLVDAPRATVLELGRNDFWFEPLIWRNPLYDLSATVRLASYLWARTHKSQLSSDRMLRRGIFNTDSEAFSLQLRILTAFVDSVSASGAEPRVVIFPGRESIDRYRSGVPTVYTPLVDSLRAQGIEPLDLIEVFLEEIGEEDAGPWFAPGGHYSPLGNQLVAEAISRILPPRGGESR